MKQLMFFMLLFLSITGLKAQDMEMPLNPQVKHGTLANGLNYYILHNGEPKNRANFYIAQKVGSSLEDKDQLGLAHFLEHMAFNGTEHYPGNSLIDYLQSKGIRFGYDINAMTGFDQTIYNINNVPCNDQALMDSVLLALYDWSGSILLEEADIDAERGVIESEYTMTSNANSRMYTALLPKLYEEYQYEQMPIGKMEIIRNFKPQTIRDYYKKWYRPDLQGIVIVGDFDANEMEQKVIALFSQIPTPQNAAERTYPSISNNEKPIYVTFEDPELSAPEIETFFKFERTPFENRNSVMAYLQDDIVAGMVEQMINNRLTEYAQKAECPYTFAGVSIGSYLVSSQKGAFYVDVYPKDNYVEAYNAAMGVITQACKTGFMGTEVQRVRDEWLAAYEKMYNEKDKTDNEVLGRELIRHFIENEPSPGIENEYALMVQILPGLPEELFNDYASSLVHIDNVAVIVSQPTTSSLIIPEENAIITGLNNVINADYEPYVDEVITEPLISKLPKEGKIKSEKDNLEMGTKEFVLSNGIKVIVKPTDYANDEVVINMYTPGGLVSYPAEEAANVQGLDFILDVSNFGPFDPNRLGKYLAGKKVNLDFGVGRNNNYFQGNSTAKDVKALFELLYSAFTEVSPNKDFFNNYLTRRKQQLGNIENNPDFIFQDEMMKTVYPNTPSLYPTTVETLDKMNYERIMQLYQAAVKNASEYTLIIAGNVDIEALKPILTQYVASIPSKGDAKPAEKVSTIVPALGDISKTIDIKSENPTVYFADVVTRTNYDFSIRNYLYSSLVGDVLQMIFLETLREEMGGIYTPMVLSAMNPYDSVWILNWYMTTNEEMKDAIIDRANVEFKKLMTEGTDNAHFSKVREAALTQLEMSERSNNYWLNALLLDQYGFNTIKNARETLETSTVEDFNNYLKSLYDGKNNIQLIGIAK